MSSHQVHPIAGMSSVRAASTGSARAASAGNDTGNGPAVGGKVLPPEAGQEPAKGAALADAVSELNDYVQTIQRDLEFSIDHDSGRTIIKVIDSKNNEVIRQIPSEEALSLARRLDQLGGGSILKVKA